MTLNKLIKELQKLEKETDPRTKVVLPVNLPSVKYWQAGEVFLKDILWENDYGEFTNKDGSERWRTVVVIE
jgi:hypothetical protein